MVRVIIGIPVNVQPLLPAAVTASKIAFYSPQDKESLDINPYKKKIQNKTVGLQKIGKNYLFGEEKKLGHTYFRPISFG